MKKMYCYDCNKDVNVIERVKKEKYQYRHKEFFVMEKVYLCPNCNNKLIDEELDNSLFNIYNGFLKLYNLSLNSFKRIRQSLNLTQEEFAKILGWSRKSIIRYENFDEIPSGEYLKIYLKLKENKDYILECLRFNQESFSEEDYYNILNKINLNLDTKSRNTILYLLDNNDLFLLPLLKNLYACDFLSYQKRKKSITNFKYAKLPFGPVVDNYTNVINMMLKTGEIKEGEGIIVNGELKTPYKNNLKVDLKIFTSEELEILKRVKQALKSKTSKELSDWSHTFKGWIETKTGNIIDYEKYAPYFTLLK